MLDSWFLYGLAFAKPIFASSMGVIHDRDSMEAGMVSKSCDSSESSLCVWADMRSFVASSCIFQLFGFISTHPESSSQIFSASISGIGNGHNPQH